MQKNKKILIAFPSGLLGLADTVAEHEHRTRSELMREATRKYIEVVFDKNPELKQKAYEQQEKGRADGILGV